MPTNSEIALLWCNWFQRDETTGLWYKWKTPEKQYTFEEAMSQINYGKTQA